MRLLNTLPFMSCSAERDHRVLHNSWLFPSLSSLFKAWFRNFGVKFRRWIAAEARRMLLRF